MHQDIKYYYRDEGCIVLEEYENQYYLKIKYPFFQSTNIFKSLKNAMEAFDEEVEQMKREYGD